MAGNDHHRLGDQAEPLLLHDRGGEAEGFAPRHGMGDIGRAEATIRQMTRFWWV